MNSKIKTTTIVEYPADEFAALIKEKVFDGEDVEIEYVIQEVGGDPLDRFPGVDTVTKVRFRFDGPPAIITRIE